MLWFILSMLVIGIIAGYLARLLVPGPDPMSFWQTVGLGVVGSFVGGFLGGLLFNAGEEGSLLGPAGIIGSIIGAIIVLLIYRAVTSKSGRSRTGDTAARR